MYVKNNIGDYAKIFEENIGLINGILKQSGISEEFRKKTFDSFNYSYNI